MCFGIVNIKICFLWWIIVFLSVFPTSAYGLKVVENINASDIVSGIIFSEIYLQNIENLNLNKLSSFCLNPVFITCKVRGNRIYISLPSSPKIHDYIRNNNDITVLIKHNIPIQEEYLSEFIPVSNYVANLLYPHFTVKINNLHGNNATVFASFDFKLQERGIIGEIQDISSGEIFTLPPIDAKRCFMRISRESTEKIIYQRAFSCERDIVEIPLTAQSGYYRLSLLSIDRYGKLYFDEKSFFIHRNNLTASIFIESETVNAGEFIRINITSKYRLIGCNIELTDIYGNPLLAEFFPNCENMFIGTRHEWASQALILKIDYYNEVNSSSIYRRITYINNAKVISDIILKKKSFFSGENIRGSITIDRYKPDMCIYRISNLKRDVIYSLKSQNCRFFDIKIPESIKTGQYIFSVELYKNAQPIAKSSTIITIESFFDRNSVYSPELCNNGFLTLDREKIPCIFSGATCIPASEVFPLCLCSEENAKKISFCHSGDICNNGYCESNIKYPYFIIRDGFRCIAYNGNIRIKCITPGDFCSDECLCVASDNRLYFCHSGDVCGFSGCSALRYIYIPDRKNLKDVSVREIEEGINLRLSGILKRYHQGKTYIATDFPGNIIAKLGRLPAKTIRTYSENNRFIIEAVFKGIISPGTYPLILYFSEKDSIFNTRYKIDVNYDNPYSKIVILDISPDILSIYNIMSSAGETMEIVVKLTDINGDIISNAKKTDFKIFLDKKQLKIDSMEFFNDFYVMSVVVKGDIEKGNHSLNIYFDSLGRNAFVSKDTQVSDRDKCQLKIIEISPGSRSNPIYNILTSIGFNLDIFLNVKNVNIFSKKDIALHILDQDISKYIEYIVPTSQGYLVHLKNVKFSVPEDKLNSYIPLYITIDKNSCKISDGGLLYIIENPGGWKNLETDL